jgi:hypothetical protein
MSLEMGSLSRLVPSLAASEQSWMGWDGMGWGWYGVGTPAGGVPLFPLKRCRTELSCGAFRGARGE